MSLAAFDNGCHSEEILSIQASIAELVNSANRTNINEKISQRYSAFDTGIKKEAIKRMKQTSIS